MRSPVLDPLETPVRTHDPDPQPLPAPVDPAVPATPPTVQATRPYPWLGASQHMVLVHDGQSVCAPSDPNLLHFSQLQETVLAGAFFEARVEITTPLPAPYDRILLPPLRRSDLMEQVVYDEHGSRLGTRLRVPALFVHANNILLHQQQGTRYDYRAAVLYMVREVGRMMSSVLRRGLLKVREKPGLMAHAQTMTGVAADEVAIPLGLAERLWRTLDDSLKAGLALRGITEASHLDGFPVWGIRFPLANDAGVQPLCLRIVPGHRKVCWLNAVNLAQRYMGDADGDLFNIILRASEVVEGALDRESRPNVVPCQDWTRTRAWLTVGHFLDPARPEQDGFSAKQQEKLKPLDLSTLQLRLRAVQDADSRQHVAVYTIAAWWIARVLRVKGGYSTRVALHRAFRLLEWYMEECMDARKGGSGYTSSSHFDPYEHMDTLLKGGPLDWTVLESLGIPAEDLETLKEAWRLAGENLRRTCSESPVYQAVILRRRSMDQSLLLMLRAFEKLQIPADQVPEAIVRDLTGEAVLEWPAELRDSTLSAADRPDVSDLYGGD